MARNEEKQLARLNRFYLQKQREEDLKKRPPRPKLESLGTPEELRKWLPSITKDIEFYVKQMEVPCYRDQQIEEFSRRIGHLRGEYKAFLRKLRELDPGNKTTPWTDRPYAVKKCNILTTHSNGLKDKDSDDSDIDDVPTKTDSEQSPGNFIPLQTPVLANDEQKTQYFGYEKPFVPNCPDPSDESMNQPLQFAPTLLPATSKLLNRSLQLHTTTRHKTRQQSSKTENEEKSSDSLCFDFDTQRTVAVSHEPNGSLNLPYSDSDSSSSADET